jgi:hypothetical protein
VKPGRLEILDIDDTFAMEWAENDGADYIFGGWRASSAIESCR